MEMEKLIRYSSRQKALDHALWLTFIHRVKGQKYGAILSIEGDYLVVPIDHPTFEGEPFEQLPVSYSNISFTDIGQIRQDAEQLSHWEELLGAFSVMDGQLLRFILEYRVDLEKLIRYELAARGHDKDGKWCGFEKAAEIWLT